MGEGFIHYFADHWEKPAELKKRVDDQAKLVEDHLKLDRFIRNIGFTHLKIRGNHGSGPRPDLQSA